MFLGNNNLCIYKYFFIYFVLKSFNCYFVYVLLILFVLIIMLIVLKFDVFWVCILLWYVCLEVIIWNKMFVLCRFLFVIYWLFKVVDVEFGVIFINDRCNVLFWFYW